MIGQVLEKSFSSGGRLKLKIQTSEGPPKWYFASDGTDGDAVMGKRIDFEGSQFAITDKKTGKQIWLDAIKNWALVKEQPVAGPVAASSVIPATLQAPPPKAAPEPAQRALSTLFDHELRFISNVVGQAILAGSCKTPDKVFSWSQAAKDVLSGVAWARVNEPWLEEKNQTISEKSAFTKSANTQAQRILEAVKAGNDRLVLEVWNECSYRLTSTEYESSVYALLPTIVQNRVKDLADMAALEGKNNSTDDVGF